MNKTVDHEVMWAVSGTGDDFQCVHVDFARELSELVVRLYDAGHCGSVTTKDDITVERARKLLADNA